MRRIRVTGPAQRDVAKILRRSGANFGNQGRNRYRHLIDQAMQDLGDDPAESAYNPSMKFERDIFSTT
jgi:plasmid stabilization system protein ParE